MGIRQLPGRYQRYRRRKRWRIKALDWFYLTDIYRVSEILVLLNILRQIGICINDDIYYLKKARLIVVIVVRNSKDAQEKTGHINNTSINLC